MGDPNIATEPARLPSSILERRRGLASLVLRWNSTSPVLACPGGREKVGGGGLGVFRGYCHFEPPLHHPAGPDARQYTPNSLDLSIRAFKFGNHLWQRAG